MSGSVPPLPLNSRTLAHWRGQLPVPAYDRDVVTPGVVHIGVGGFHRAHQAMYHDRMMNEGTALDWGICGVGVTGGRPGDAAGTGRPGRPLHPGA